MRAQVSLGRIAGIPVGLNLSVLVAFALVTDIVATQTLPGEAAGYSRAAYWAVGVGVGLLFFAALFAHELAHAVVARRLDVRVERITLWMLGGVAEFASEPPTASADLRIAAAGPLASLAAGLGFGTAAGATAALGGPALAVAALGWLGGINVLLGVFNLLPAAPLDGGRILRGLVWRRTHDRTRAALVADRAGRGLGTALIVLGAAEALLTTQIFGGLWFMLLGWFLRSAASAEAQVTRRHALLDGVTVAAVMRADPVCLPEYQTVDAALPRVLETGHATYPVVSFEGKPVGLVLSDALVRLPGALRANHRVGDVAIALRRLPTAGPDEALADALDRMVGPLPLLVISDGRLVGIVTQADTTPVLRRAALAYEATGHPDDLRL